MEVVAVARALWVAAVCVIVEAALGDGFLGSEALGEDFGVDEALLDEVGLCLQRLALPDAARFLFAMVL